ncbi:hypothetical protein GQ43DRAFT_440671 [Delitschia confertaspora ATCC 74209]|uniref:Uncharacterized protein n=1 Tax=Delitschia confertaspora ATCC 74209 TaxID=1513339 RepID=A0A9P4MVP2_9PLEO|nr:hypothetical protein GQ43DRAFT_440671 [Delitschia confertaspora ATCC 74209]
MLRSRALVIRVVSTPSFSGIRQSQYGPLISLHLQHPPPQSDKIRQCFVASQIMRYLPLEQLRVFAGQGCPTGA